MSEPPEQEEVEEPEDPAAADADLEELLEQFREPEELPRKRANPLWLISAFLLSVLACWLAFRASGGSVEEKPESAALAGAMLPGKTSERLPRDEGPVDVVEDYLARCKKGMTAQEVRWIVEDFQRAGLGEEVGSLSERINNEIEASDSVMNADAKAKVLELALDLGRRQRDWYAVTLEDALHLDQQQKLELRANLQLALKVDRKQSEEDWDSLAALELPSRVDDGLDGLMVVGGLVTAAKWIDHELYAPWKLTTLTEEQLSITRYNKLRVANRPDARDWLLLLPEEMEMGDAPGLRLSRMTMVLPPTSEQKLPQFGEIMLDEAKLLHPAQLRLQLLFAPAGAQRLLEALEEAGE